MNILEFIIYTIIIVFIVPIVGVLFVLEGFLIVIFYLLMLIYEGIKKIFKFFKPSEVN